jgi:RNA polymerase sigma factor (sigma-70 family)
VSDEERLEARLNEQFEFLWGMVTREVKFRRLPADHIDEVVDHVILIVYERWAKGKGRGLSSDAWRASLTTIARNEISNVVRRFGKRHAEVPLHDDIPSPRAHEHDQVLDRLTESQLRAAIKTLGEPERSLLSLAVWEHMRLSEAADVLGLDREVAKRAMRNLADKIERLKTGGTVKGSKAPGIRAFARALVTLTDRGDGRA